MSEHDHPVAKLVRETAEARGMNYKITPPATPDGEWDFKIWPKGRPEPDSSEVAGNREGGK